MQKHNQTFSIIKRTVIFLCFGLVALALGVTSFPCWSLAQSASPIFSKALELYKAGDFEMAKEMFFEGLKIDGKNALAWYYLGKSNKALNYNKPGQLLAFKNAYKLSPDSDFGIDALVEIKRLNKILEIESQKELAATKQRRLETTALKAVNNSCYQTKITERDMVGNVVCFCLSNYTQGNSLDSDSIMVSASVLGAQPRWGFKYYVRGDYSAYFRLSTERENIEVVLGIGTVSPKSWFVNHKDGEEDVVLRGKEAEGSLDFSLEVPLHGAGSPIILTDYDSPRIDHPVSKGRQCKLK